MNAKRVGFFIFILIFSTQLKAQEISSDSLDEYHTFMFDLIDEIVLGEYERFFSIVNFDAIVETAVEDIPLPEYDKRSLKLGLIQGAKSEFVTAYTSLLDLCDLIQYVSYTELEGYYSILVRFSGEAGLNYIEFVLGKDEEGNISIIDYYPFMLGEYVTTTINRTVKITYSEDSVFEKLLSGLSNKEKEFTTNLPKLTKIRNLTINGLYEEAKMEYDALPLSVQNNKLFILTILTAAQVLGDEIYLSLIDKFEEFYPNDPSIPLITLDSYLLRGNIEEAQRQIDNLDEAIGGDNFLNIMRGNIAMIGEDSASARSYFNLAIENDVYSEDAYWGLINLDVVNKDYGSTIKYLNRLVYLYGYYFTSDDFNSEPFLEFKESEEFKEWIITQ